MPALTVPLDYARGLFLAQAEAFVLACRGYSDIDLLDPSLCRGWSRLDLLVHVRTGLDELAASAAVRTSRKPDHDAATYWSSDPDDRDDDPVAHILWLRRTASAYGRPAAAVQHLADATERACAVVRGLPEGALVFQGKVMTAGDFVTTWVVELAIHQLDLDPASNPVGAPLARRTLNALAMAPLLPHLPDAEAVLAGLGRSPWPSGEEPGPFPISL